MRNGHAEIARLTAKYRRRMTRDVGGGGGGHAAATARGRDRGTSDVSGAVSHGLEGRELPPHYRHSPSAHGPAQASAGHASAQGGAAAQLSPQSLPRQQHAAHAPRPGSPLQAQSEGGGGAWLQQQHQHRVPHPHAQLSPQQHRAGPIPARSAGATPPPLAPTSLLGVLGSRGASPPVRGGSPGGPPGYHPHRVGSPAGSAGSAGAGGARGGVMAPQDAARRGSPGLSAMGF